MSQVEQLELIRDDIVKKKRGSLGVTMNFEYSFYLETDKKTNESVLFSFPVGSVCSDELHKPTKLISNNKSEKNRKKPGFTLPQLQKFDLTSPEIRFLPPTPVRAAPSSPTLLAPLCTAEL